MIEPKTNLFEDLYHLIDRLSAARGLESVLDEVLSAAMALTRSEMGNVSIDSRSSGAFVSPVFKGFPDDYVEHMSTRTTPVKGGPRERAFLTQRRVFVPDVFDDPSFEPFLPWVRRAGFVSMQATPIISRNSDPIGTICTYQRDQRAPTAEQLYLLDIYGKLAADAIERERAELSLRENEGRLRLATQGGKVYPWEVDLRSNKIWYVGNLEEFGVPSSGSSTREIIRLIRTNARGLARRSIRTAMAGTGRFEFEVPLQNAEGASSWFRISGELMRNQSGRVDRLVGIGKNITGHKRAADRLGKSEQRFRRLYGLMVRLSGVSGLQASLDEVLAAALELLETDMGNVRLHHGNDDDMAVVAATRGLPQQYLDYFASLPIGIIAGGPAVESLRTGKTVIVEDVAKHPPFTPHLPVVHQAGYVSTVACPLITRSGKAIGCISVLFRKQNRPTSDQLQILELYARLAADTIEREEYIAEQGRSEDALKNALALRNEFLGLVSHELRTPMTVIRGLSSVLNRESSLKDDDVRAAYQDLRDESERLYWLIENMLMLARVEAGRQPELDALLLDRLISGIADRLVTTLPQVRLQMEPLPQDIVVSAIQTYVEQILHNLVENAAKYNSREMPVEIWSRVEPHFVRVCVADRGIGVRHPELLFQPFHREKGAEESASGLGLGLAVCRTLVEAQGGEIGIEVRPGGGSVFYFTLPRISWSGD